jgi:D-serine deaminase-like pyridoxal phosphate-dependent protein
MTEPEVFELHKVASPALLIFEEQVRANIDCAIEMAGGVDRIRPHLKTHKSPDVLRMQQAAGIYKFKCATIAEAEMAARAGAQDVLLALQPTGPNARRLIELKHRYPKTSFSTIGDDGGALRELSAISVEAGASVDVLLDIDCGMRRTGVSRASDGVALYRLLDELPGLAPGGLHFYDGHVLDRDIETRRRHHRGSMGIVGEVRDELVALGYSIPRMVGGGSPTFSMHAEMPGVECSPGTLVFWDAGYGARFPDLLFEAAAWVLTRVISKPGKGCLCLDLGHKSIASEQPLDERVFFPGMPGARFRSHSEEHLVVETADADRYEVGKAFLGIPWHVCPTVALYGIAVVIRAGKMAEEWPIVARKRRLDV